MVKREVRYTRKTNGRFLYSDQSRSSKAEPLNRGISKNDAYITKFRLNICWLRCIGLKWPTFQMANGILTFMIGHLKQVSSGQQVCDQQIETCKWPTGF